jgi:hypothetical protein
MSQKNMAEQWEIDRRKPPAGPEEEFHHRLCAVVLDRYKICFSLE